MSKYHHLLGLRPGASLEEIKKAYRKKAFELHPDKNKSGDAHDKFIEVTIAYEMLSREKPNLETNTEKKSAFKYRYTRQAPVNTEDFNSWYNYTKQKAGEQAKYRYDEFRKNNDAFKKTSYYPFVKFFTLLVILISTSFTLGLFSIPFCVLLIGENWILDGVTVFYFIPGVWAYNYTMELIKGYRIHFSG